ncbi:MAG TPA: hypothetical protein VLF67_04215, partial [Candidatus Saccharimonas sp.]|nr:hypothetical protein [Candidatus Saccharimonas sp.]
MTGTAEQTLLVTDGPKQGALLRLGLFWIVSSSGPPRALLLRAWLDGRNTHQLFTLMAEHWQ